MEIKILLNGGLKTCCSSYPTEQIRSVMQQWFGHIKDMTVTVLDAREEKIDLDELGALAFELFGDQIFPAVYAGDKLMALGNLPDRGSLLKMAKGDISGGISKDDILQAANNYGVSEADLS